LALTKVEKKRLIEELADKLKNAGVIILTDYKGMNVPQISKLRDELKEKEVIFKVVKNTLMEKACHEIGKEELTKGLVGNTAIVLGNLNQEVTEPIRLIKEYAEKNKVELKIKSALVEGRYLNAEKVVVLASLPAKEILLAQAIAGIKAPLYSLVFVLPGPLRELIYTLEAIKGQKEVKVS